MLQWELREWAVQCLPERAERVWQHALLSHGELLRRHDVLRRRDELLLQHLRQHLLRLRDDLLRRLERYLVLPLRGELLHRRVGRRVVCLHLPLSGRCAPCPCVAARHLDGHRRLPDAVRTAEEAH